MERNVDRVELGAWRKNTRVEVRGSVFTYKGRRVVDLREHILDGPDGEPLATRKGLCVRVQQIGLLAAVVEAARKRVLDEGYALESGEPSGDGSGQEPDDAKPSGS